MPHHKQFKKSLRKTQKLTLRNRMIKSKIKTLVKKVRLSTNRTAGEEALKNALPVLDSSVHKGILHNNTVARTKSRLHKLVASLPKKKA